jgi:hypothetical protein
MSLLYNGEYGDHDFNVVDVGNLNSVSGHVIMER